MQMSEKTIQPVLGLPGLNPLPRKMPSASLGKNPRFIVPILNIE
jgi:hypothetical protein